MPTRTMRYTLPCGLAVVAGLGLCVAAAFDAFVSANPALTRDVRAALTWVPPPPPPDGGLLITHACFAKTDLMRGQLMALLTFLLGGLPCALTAATIARVLQNRAAASRADWTSCIHAGLVFQVCSLTVSVLLFLVLTAAAVLVEPSAVVNPSGAVLLLLAACNGWGLTTWRALEQQRPLVALALTRS